VTTRDQVLARIQQIPSLPASVTAAIKMVRDPEAKVSDLARLIEYEPSLALNVLRLANSAYFGRPRSVSSIKDAVIRLGMNNIMRLVLSCALMPLENQPLSGYGLAQGELWEHSASVAIAAETLLKTLGRKVPEHTFTAGLVHDVGKLALATFVEDDSQRIRDYSFGMKMSFEEAEREILGIDHAEAGAILLENWNLPQTIIEVVRWHHEPESVPNEELALDAVHTADALIMTGGIGTGSDALNYRLSPMVLARLGVTVDVAETVLGVTMTAVDELRDLFFGKSSG